jgi:hypothetical protein
MEPKPSSIMTKKILTSATLTRRETLKKMIATVTFLRKRMMKQKSLSKLRMNSLVALLIRLALNLHRLYLI